MPSRFQADSLLLAPEQGVKTPSKLAMQDELSTSNRSSQPIASGAPTSTSIHLPTFPQRPIRPSVHVSPSKTLRTMSHPVHPTVSPVAEEPIITEPKKSSPVLAQASGANPVIERHSVNSRSSVRRRASTSASHIRQ